VISSRQRKQATTLEVFNPCRAEGVKAACLSTRRGLNDLRVASLQIRDHLGDEAREPRRTIRVRLMRMMLTTGGRILYVSVSHAVTTVRALPGAHCSKARATRQTPFNTLADHYGNGCWSVFVNLAVISEHSRRYNIVTVIAVSASSGKMGQDASSTEVVGGSTPESPHVACLGGGRAGAGGVDRIRLRK